MYVDWLADPIQIRIHRKKNYSLNIFGLIEIGESGESIMIDQNFLVDIKIGRMGDIYT